MEAKVKVKVSRSSTDMSNPNLLIKESTLKSLKEIIIVGDPFRYILSFDNREEAEEALEMARRCKPPSSILYYRQICQTRDNGWRLYISNHKLQTYSILE